MLEGLSGFLSLATKHPDAVPTREEASFQARIHLLDLQTSHMAPLGLSIKAGLLSIFHGPRLRAGLRGGQGAGEWKEGLTEDRLRPRGRGKTVKGGVKLGCQARGGCRVCWTPEPSSCRPRPHLPLPSNCNTSGTCPLWCFPEEGVGPHTLSTHPSREPHPGAGTASWPGGPRSAPYRGPPCARCVASARPLPDSGPQWTRWP